MESKLIPYNLSKGHAYGVESVKENMPLFIPVGLSESESSGNYTSEQTYDHLKNSVDKNNELLAKSIDLQIEMIAYLKSFLEKVMTTKEQIIVFQDISIDEIKKKIMGLIETTGAASLTDMTAAMKTINPLEIVEALEMLRSEGEVE